MSIKYEKIQDNINLNTYETISSEFSATRFSVWRCVKDLTHLIKKNDYVLEIGCGNGKNMKYIINNIDCKIVGFEFPDCTVFSCNFFFCSDLIAWILSGSLFFVSSIVAKFFNDALVNST